MHVPQTAADLPPCLSHLSSLMSPDIVTLDFNQLMPSFSISYSVWLNQTLLLPLAFSAFLLVLYHVHMPTFIAMQNACLWVFYHIAKEAAEHVASHKQVLDPSLINWQRKMIYGLLISLKYVQQCHACPPFTICLLCFLWCSLFSQKVIAKKARRNQIGRPLEN